jgi:hypothetical protein
LPLADQQVAAVDVGIAIGVALRVAGTGLVPNPLFQWARSAPLTLPSPLKLVGRGRRTRLMTRTANCHDYFWPLAELGVVVKGHPSAGLA